MQSGNAGKRSRRCENIVQILTERLSHREAQIKSLAAIVAKLECLLEAEKPQQRGDAEEDCDED